MKGRVLLLCSVLLVGCSSSNNTPTVEESTVQQDIVKEDNLQDNHLQDDIETNNNMTETIENGNSTNEDIDKVDVDEVNEIHIETEGFVENMDKLFTDLEDYEGKQLTYEGLLIQTEEKGNEYAVVRTYEMNHEDHSHSIYVGLDTTYEGEWPKVNSWVKVTGTIQKANSGGEDYPVLQIQEITVMPEVGQLNVTN